jgi:hypothetical protein
VSVSSLYVNIDVDSTISIIVAQKPTPVRKTTLDPETVTKLDKALSERPEKSGLVERNILKGPYNVA